jgi:hypothetical protein
MPKSGHVYSTAAASNTITVAAANTNTNSNNNDNNKEDENFPLSLSTYSSPFFLLQFLSSSSLHHGILYVCHLPTQIT